MSVSEEMIERQLWKNKYVFPCYTMQLNFQPQITITFTSYRTRTIKGYHLIATNEYYHTTMTLEFWQRNYVPQILQYTLKLLQIQKERR
jgi:hypothetical protein